MSSQHKSGKTLTKSTKRTARKAGTAVAVAASRRRANPRIAKQVKAAVQTLPSRTTRFLKSHPVRVLLGATAMGVVVAKLRHLI